MGLFLPPCICNVEPCKRLAMVSKQAFSKSVQSDGSCGSRCSPSHPLRQGGSLPKRLPDVCPLSSDKPPLMCDLSSHCQGEPPNLPFLRRICWYPSGRGLAILGVHYIRSSLLSVLLVLLCRAALRFHDLCVPPMGGCS